MIIKAHAKINLGLDVVGLRENGYHDVSMVMQSLALHDKVSLEASPPKGADDAGRIHVTCNLPFIPTDASNLAYKAAACLMDRFGVTDCLSIDLDKHIPVAAGLAGGSADAAAVLLGANQLFRLGLSDEDLREIGAGIGADIPFCLMKGTAKAEGIGEKLTRLPPMPDCGILLVKPSFSVSTKKVYRDLDARPTGAHPDIDAIIASLRAGDLTKLAGSLGNILESVTADDHPVIRELKEAMLREGALGALMSGSGPTVYGLFRTKEEAFDARNRLKPLWQTMRWIVTSPLQEGGVL